LARTVTTTSTSQPPQNNVGPIGDRSRRKSAIWLTGSKNGGWRHQGFLERQVAEPRQGKISSQMQGVLLHASTLYAVIV
jgi:hypothetical protein